MEPYDPEKEDKYKETESEMEKVQKEISKDLKKYSLEEVKAEEDKSTLFNEKPETFHKKEQVDSSLEEIKELEGQMSIEEFHQSIPNETIETKDGFDESSIEMPSNEERESIYLEEQNLPQEMIQENIKEDRKKKEKRSTAQSVLLVVVAALVLGLSMGAGYGFVNNFYNSKKSHSNLPSEPFSFDRTTDTVEYAEGTFSKEGYADLVQKVEPSVVNINSYYGDTEGQSFFEVPSSQIAGSGSGILFHEEEGNLYIVTNAHVISGANKVEVSLTGFEAVNASLVGKDDEADLAVISVLKTDLEAVGIHKVSLATFGDSDTMRMGDFVLAIGNSMGEGNSVTNGIISAKDKVIETQVDGQTKATTLDVIQTNAAINRGNSGGPLINLDGEVIGINTAKMAEQSLVSQDPTVEGMGYAIPSNKAKDIVEDLMDGKVKPSLGVTVSDMTEEVATQYNLPQAGVIVHEVVEGAAADKGGIMAMDIITGFDDKSIMTVEQLLKAISEKEVGDKVDIKLIRDGEMKTISVTLQERPENQF